MYQITTKTQLTATQKEATKSCKKTKSTPQSGDQGGSVLNPNQQRDAGDYLAGKESFAKHALDGKL